MRREERIEVEEAKRLLSEERRNSDDIKFIKWSAVFLFLFALLVVVVTFKTGRKEIEELESQAQLFQHCSPASGHSVHPPLPPPFSRAQSRVQGEIPQNSSKGEI